MPTDGPATSGLGVLTGASLALDDYSKIVDKSDPASDPVHGTDKQITEAERIAGLSRLFTEPMMFPLFGAADALAGQAGDNILHWHVPPHMAGKKIVGAYGYVDVVSSSGLVTVALRNVTQSNVDVFSTNLTVDPGELNSTTAATPVVVNGANAVLAAHDKMAFDLDTVGTGVFGLYVTLLIGPA